MFFKSRASAIRMMYNKGDNEFVNFAGEIIYPWAIYSDDGEKILELDTIDDETLVTLYDLQLEPELPKVV